MRTASPESPRAGDDPHGVGRDREVARIRALAPRPGENGRVLHVLGPAGVGKTTLLRRALADVSAAEVPTIAITLREAIDLPDALARDLCRAVAALDGAPAASGAARRVRDAVRDGRPLPATALVHGLGWLVADVAEAHGLVLALDNAHLAAGLDRDIIGELARWSEETPLTLILAARCGAGSDPDLPASPQSHPEVLRLAGAAPARLRPEGVTTPPALEVLAAVALAGRWATPELVARIAGIDVATTETLAEQAGLGHGEVLAFAHSRDAAAAVDRLGPAALRDLHHRTARVLADQGLPLEVVARHLVRAAPVCDPVDVERLVAAAQESRSAGRTTSAIEMVTAIDVDALPAGLRGAVLRTAGTILSDAGDERGPALLDASLRHLSDARDRLAVRLQKAAVDARFGRGSQALCDLDVLRAEADPADHPEIDLAWARIGRLLLPHRSAALQRQSAVLEQVTPERHVASLTARLCAEIAFEYAVDPVHTAPDVLSMAARATAGEEITAEESLDEWGWFWCGYAFHLAGDNDRAREVLDRTVDAAVTSGNRAVYVDATALRSGPHFHQGRLLEAAADAELAIAAGRRNGHLVLAPTRGTLAQLRLWRGDLAGARAMLVAQDDAPWQDSGGDMLFLYGLALVLLHDGRPEEAIDHLRRAGAMMETGEGHNPAMLPWRSLAAEAAIALGRREEAAHWAAEELELARRFTAPGPLGIALRASALAIAEDDPDGAIDLLREAIEAHTAGERRVEHIQTLLDHGRLLRRCGDTPGSREQLREAMGLADRVDARRLVEAARTELIRSGGRPRRTAMTGVRALTPAELRVLQMAAGERTNREIAEALFLSVKAVEWHLTQVYRKLGVRRRSEAIAQFRAPTSA